MPFDNVGTHRRRILSKDIMIMLLVCFRLRCHSPGLDALRILSKDVLRGILDFSERPYPDSRQRGSTEIDEVADQCKPSVWATSLKTFVLDSSLATWTPFGVVCMQS
ncbi:AD domain-containing protein [Psidium guajava]|nr:AD domain-containing protein [Psidium guajava]